MEGYTNRFFTAVYRTTGGKPQQFYRLFIGNTYPSNR